MKRKIGISIYPEQSNFESDKKYLDLAKKLGYEVMFTSVLHFVTLPDAKNRMEAVLKSTKYAKEIGFYTIVDVEYESLNLLGMSVTNLDKCIEYGIDCIRLDSPSLPKEIADVTHNKAGIDVQLNMSLNDSLIYNVIDFKPVMSRLKGCHNFYPLEDTGLPFNFFKECNKKFLENRLETAAFVGSHNEQRFLSVKSQGKMLFYSNEIDVVLFGNAYATEEELKELAEINRYEITFDIDLDPKITELEKRVLTDMDHFRRGDITDVFIRSTFSRVKFKNDIIKPKNNKKTLNLGDVVIINDNDPKYKGEELMAENKNQKTEFINREIRFKQVIIISEDGSKIGPINKFEAIQMAEEKGLDLFQVGVQDGGVAITKIIDYGKYKYEQKRKMKENKKNQVKTENREIRLTVNIGDHDIETKAKKAREFLIDGDRVKISLKFKGREIAYQQFGIETLNKFFAKIEDVAKIEKEAKLNTRFLDMYVVPKK
ncbi:hypothetical protein FQR65_LT15357 [Abscondita terminalis]|nr:hypothetical protein FQR65_LT15357 [Abscondita terminalis]